jgi:hypothetical protein
MRTNKANAFVQRLRRSSVNTKMPTLAQQYANGFAAQKKRAEQAARKADKTF